jgi:uncharacterized protein YdaU (DUF1376 family)
MTRRPSFQFYPEDFLVGTNGMSRAAVGAYINMLCQAWAAGPVPDTPRALWKALGLGPDDPSFDHVWPEVRPKWVLRPEGWINLRLEEVRATQDRYSEQQRARGQRGGRTTQGRSSAGSSKRLSTRSSSALALALASALPSPSPSAIKKVQRADAPDMHKVLVKLAHSVLDDQPGPTADSELAEELKTRAAKARIPYNGRAVTKALDAARGHRSRR